MSVFNRLHLNRVGGLALLSASACLPSQPTSNPEAGSYPARSDAIAEPPDLSQVTVHPLLFADVRINTPRGIDLASAA